MFLYISYCFVLFCMIRWFYLTYSLIQGEVTYAELSLPTSVYATLIRKPPPKCQETIYSQIDPALCLATAETPLISHTRDSAAVSLRINI